MVKVFLAPDATILRAEKMFKGESEGGLIHAVALRGGQEVERDDIAAVTSFASTCLLWCAIGIGALARGRPVTSVSLR